MWCVFLRSSNKFSVIERNISSRSIRNVSSAASYLHNPGSEPLQYRTVGDVLEQAAHRWPNRPAVRSVHQRLTLTYSQLLTQADALGCGLRAAGLERGDRLGVWAHNCAEWVVTLAAAARAGLVPVALNPAYEEAEMRFCMQHVGMKALLVADQAGGRDYQGLLRTLLPELARSAPGRLRSETFPELTAVVSMAKETLSGVLKYQDLIKEFEFSAATEISKYSSEVQPEDGYIIHFTSGTTGQPKAALDSHFGMINNTYFLGKRTTLHYGHETLCVQVPIFHAFGTVITVLTALRHGATLVLPSAFYSPRANLQALLTEGCTVVHGTPTMFVDAVNLARQGGQSPRLRVALTAGAPCSPQLFRDIQTHLNVESVKSLFGMTETTAAVFQSIEGESMDKVTDTVGYVHDHVEVKVVDENLRAVEFGKPGELLVRGYNVMLGYWGEPDKTRKASGADGRLTTQMCQVVDENLRAVEFGKPGELLVRGYNVMLGYWGEPDKTRKAIGADGWYRTGDQFAISEDGYGRIVGRIKDMIIRGGENIYPKEIEDVLNTHPDVIESQVFGVPDPRLGEEVCVALRTRDNVPLALQALAAHCQGKLASYKLPRLVKSVESFPKTASGKVQKHRLREMVEKGTL